MLTIFGPIQWAFSLLPKWESSWAKWLTRYLTVHFYGAMLYFVISRYFITNYISDTILNRLRLTQQSRNKNIIKCCAYIWGVSLASWNQTLRVWYVNSPFLTYAVYLAFDEANLPLSWAKIIWQHWQINMWQSYKFPVRLAAFTMNNILQKLSGILAR